MKNLRFTEKFKVLFQSAVRLREAVNAEAVMLVLEGPADWGKLKRLAEDTPFLVAADTKDELLGAAEEGISAVPINLGGDSPVHERLTQAVLEAVADDMLPPNRPVVAIYSGFEPDQIDSISIINLGEHLDRLTGHDLRQLETRVPLDVLKQVVDLACEIGREGREGKPIGALFAVGDSRKVMLCSKPAGFDPVKGYNRKDRNVNYRRVREGIKEIAQLDGAFVISSDGTIEASCRYLDSSAATVTLSKGLGARHWAAAAISRATKAIAIAVSESNGTVRIFQDGEVVLRIEPHHRRPVVWREFEFEPPGTDG